VLRRVQSVAWWLPTVVALTPACSGSASGDWDAIDDEESSGGPSDGANPDAGITPATSEPGEVPGAVTPAPNQTETPNNSTPTGSTRSPVTSTPPGSSDPVTPTPTGAPTPPEHAPPTVVCSGNLPASFTNSCSGCHNAAGSANDRYPDLYDFAGSEADFIAKVRSGGKEMVPYPESALADEDLTAIYAYFTGNASRPTAQSAELGDLVPLFDGSANPPITFTRADGALITRGAGRVRQRHELEGTFNPFGAHYFEDRSFGILVEDYTPLGQSLIQVTYLPVGQPTEGTNFRAWKIYGEGNVFHANMGMDTATLPNLDGSPVDMTANYADVIAPYKALQAQKTTSNSRTGEPIAAGDTFEFEFGVFLEAGEVREGSRTSYYSDTYRYRVGQGGFTADNADSAGQLGPVRRAQQGGDGTNVWLYEDQEFAFEQMALNIQHENLQPFLRGRRLFHTDFETGEHSEGGNPTFEEQVGKAGPTLLTNACVTCHEHNGPGEMLVNFDESASTTFKLYDAGELGNQLQLGEGNASIVETESTVVTLGDGTEVTLSKPKFSVTTQEGEELHHSARLARKLVGLGLLEAVDEATVLLRSDPADCDADGISGRPSLVIDPETGTLGLGRFGWKAEKVSVRHQVMDALQGDLDVGTAALPDSAGNVEFEEADLRDLTAYMRLLSVPAQRDVDAEAVTTGEALFRTVGCAQCHVTDVVTGTKHPFVELQSQSIKPYTDLLLHDMGEGLADASDLAEGDEMSPPGASEWRTPPLWAIGLYAAVNGNTGLLHDGRAANVNEAILWHGGEASEVRERFAALSEGDRAALLAFVESL
jgi:CxxC motif-containing protein (DUF1111 family)